MKYTTLSCRLFVKDRHGNPVRLQDVSIQHISAVGKRSVASLEIADGGLPDILDTVFPRDYYLVYQTTDDDLEFFDPDPNRTGSMIVLKDALIRYDPPEFTCLMMDRSTGQLLFPSPDFTLVVRSIERA